MSSLPTRKQVVYGSISFSLQGIRSMMADLSMIVGEQGELELSQTRRREDQTEEDYQVFVESARRDIFKVLTTVSYADGSSLVTSDPADVQIGDDGLFISSIFMSNRVPYKSNVGVEPEHVFELFLDFRQPRLIDPGEYVSSPTSNETNLNVSGRRPAWRSAIEDMVRKRIKKRRTIRTYLHAGFVYDLGMMLFGMPAAFYFCWLLSSWIEKQLGSVHPVVSATAYIYVGLCILWIYRIFFSYTKWAFPLVEITDQATKPAAHRKIWWLIVTIVFGKLFWNLADPFVSLPFWLESVSD
jgi:hypothetical protein